MWPKLYAVETDKKMIIIIRHCAPDKCIFYCRTKLCGYVDPLTYNGILDFNGHLKVIKTRFCCKRSSFSHCENQHVPVYKYRYI